MEPGYPLRCQPCFQNYLWGGRKLATRLGKNLPDDGLWAESWEIIDHPHHQSLVTNGPKAGKTLREIIQETPDWLLGRRLRMQGIQSLPLLLKYLDCQNVLSIQVHPDDRYAKRMDPPDLGKTEAWYILDAAPGAILYAGLMEGTTADDVRAAIASGDLQRCLHSIGPKAGDCVFIPAGTVHALGAGLLVAEIQQASNTTFRLYDWDRLGPDGKRRPLHIEQALDVIDFQSGPRNLQEPISTSQKGRCRLVTCDQFVLDKVSHPTASESPVPLSDPVSIEMQADGSFHLMTVPQGSVELIGETFHEKLNTGQSILLPAAVSNYSANLLPGSILLDMYISA